MIHRFREEIQAMREVYPCSFYICTPYGIRICRVWRYQNKIDVIYMLDLWLELKGAMP